MPFAGTHRGIRRPDLLTFDAMGAAGTVRLEAAEIPCRSREHLEQFLQRGVDVGTSRTLDSLVSHVGGLEGPDSARSARP